MKGLCAAAPQSHLLVWIFNQSVVLVQIVIQTVLGLLSPAKLTRNYEENTNTYNTIQFLQAKCFNYPSAEISLKEFK